MTGEPWEQARGISLADRLAGWVGTLAKLKWPGKPDWLSGWLARYEFRPSENTNLKAAARGHSRTWLRGASESDSAETRFKI